VSPQYVEVVLNGLWFTPLREALDAYVAKIQERVNGVVRLTLFKGDCRVVHALSGQALPSNNGDDALDSSARLISVVNLPGEVTARKP
jgi:argininosuccinate synthase